MVAAAADSKICEVHPESNRYQDAVFRKYFDGALASESVVTFVDKETGDIIGSSRYDDRRDVYCVLSNIRFQ